MKVMKAISECYSFLSNICLLNIGQIRANDEGSQFLCDFSKGLISLPIMYLLPYIAHSWKVWLITKCTGDYDNINPRLNTDRVEQTVSNKELVKKIKRLEGLHYNLLENFGPWAGAVLAARFTGVSTLWTNYTAIVFLGARIAHFVCYAFGTTLAVANIRSLSFFVSMMATFFLYFLSIKQVW